MLTKYIDNPDYDLAGSFVIGDRPTDVELAKNLGCRAIYLQDSTESLKEKKDWRKFVHLQQQTGIRWQSSFCR